MTTLTKTTIVDRLREMDKPVKVRVRSLYEEYKRNNKSFWFHLELACLGLTAGSRLEYEQLYKHLDKVIKSHKPKVLYKKIVETCRHCHSSKEVKVICKDSYEAQMLRPRRAWCKYCAEQNDIHSNYPRARIFEW
jgi:CRISPR/Cas system-associated protein Cas10 (large subunit of type III CRISPR-Cas system)